MKLRLLGTSGLRVTEFCLGTMTFGEDWGWGADKATSQQIFTTFVERGGNFIDTANNYTNGSSERFVGEFIHAERDRFVVATKYTLRNNGQDEPHNPNLGGNSRKSMMRSVENSLRRLNTDYIDLLYLHMWDYTTPLDEILRSVDDLVRAGKVLYFGFSDTPAWIVSAAVIKAEAYGWTRPIAIQIPYSLLSRDPENDIIPMANAFDLSVLPWGILEAGALTGKYNTDTVGPRRMGGISDRRRQQVQRFLDVVMAETDLSPVQTAVNWVRQQPGNIIPILGARTVAQIQDSLGALNHTLTAEQMERLNEIARFRRGFPVSFFNDHIRELIFGDTFEKIDNFDASAVHWMVD